MCYHFNDAEELSSLSYASLVDGDAPTGDGCYYAVYALRGDGEYEMDTPYTLLERLNPGIGGQTDAIDRQTFETDGGGADVTATAVQTFRVNNSTVDGTSVKVAFDEMLKDPVPVSITLVFNAPGTYEIRLYLRKAGSISSSSASVRITVK